MLINKNIKAGVTSVKEADKKIIEALKPVYQNEKAKVKLVNQLAMNTVDWILLASDNKQNAEKVLPTYDQVKAHLKDLAKSVVPQIIDIGENGTEKKKADPNELSRLSSSISDAVKTALLVAGHETGFIIGHRMEDKSAFISKDKAHDNNKLKPGIIKDIFWSPIKTFPNKNIGTENTIEAFNNSIKHNLNIEIDLQLSSDMEIVVYHDINMSRIHNIDKKISEMVYGDLCNYNIHNLEFIIKLIKNRNIKCIMDIKEECSLNISYIIDMIELYCNKYKVNKNNITLLVWIDYDKYGSFNILKAFDEDYITLKELNNIIKLNLDGICVKYTTSLKNKYTSMMAKNRNLIVNMYGDSYIDINMNKYIDLYTY